ncbi:uncharacterized protein LOC100677904 isoform X2 [Nasonia vitripennis]|uniref:EMI domain-containing protein n=1 Tax=Nasonia vitripennis TaxID=7425 RepID=A0A7M7R2A3_NASVI|nr:uncharacterized protein LOC100677904 isoform X2 [Nasonia vitripennis]XP_032456231.1 uncharacterized protein LOC100677904 isoform X2 [Nasonia vitripennis]XP_032456232.1 uncharacterized protein LOC100677904 isoform X2 [Nasonia vitripennis]
MRGLVIFAATLAALALQPASALTGEHVCHRVENYTVTSREQYVEPVEIHTLAWCLQIPPRCPQTRTELRERWRMKTEVKFKSVPVCCEGYAIQEPVGNGSAEAKCVPHCKRCRSGVCIAPNECACDPGFQGQDCASECPQGTWGPSCKNECNCLREVACNTVSGKCECPAGWMGSRCENKCPEGHWGAGCNSICLCENQLARCHHETGECSESASSVSDPFEASGIAANLVPAASTAKTADTDYVDIVDFDKEDALLSRVTEQVPVIPDDNLDPIIERNSVNVEPAMLPESKKPPTTEGISTKTIEEKPRRTTPVLATSPLPPQPGPTVSIEGNQLSQPDDAERSKSAGFDFDERHTNFRVIVSPKTEYVKNTHKDDGSPMSGIPIDVATMIVVGAIVSIGLTAVAALMIFHVRSRLLKAALSIYSQEKVERQQFPEKDSVVSATTAAGKGLDVTIGTLPRTMTRVNPVYNAGPEAAVLTFDERPAEYANGTVTIGIRLSSNLRDLLESHYDRPAACSHRNVPAGGFAPGDADVEHVYDEIPLSAPFYFAKDT